MKQIRDFVYENLIQCKNMQRCVVHLCYVQSYEYGFRYLRKYSGNDKFEHHIQIAFNLMSALSKLEALCFYLTSENRTKNDFEKL
ncbi:CLUMA_CG010366, isoform A [Clunio marinus]|uniref:CLUMA_CG010366, isoform A n=1 Tax=Clunio marinus TaxID=568069 RepID=A0A1J1IEY3_9DIPT|nr:CLUMA_CG010366, isoform A [Clunio marinus]